MVHCALNNAQAIPDYKLPPGEPVFALWHAGALFQDNVKARGVNFFRHHLFKAPI
jgi:hypothetical protein